MWLKAVSNDALPMANNKNIAKFGEVLAKT